MLTTNIQPTQVSFNQLANAVSFQVLTLDLKPTAFKLNARFFLISKTEAGESSLEVANVPFEMPIETFNTWVSDQALADACIEILGLTKA